ncbi:MAG TPA: phenylphosphate carboxylase subunit delta [Candidatus Krumholzibacteria bacterium]|nr:phenylphosphate carboxylase subunit delta [Candidatus Krumholzibacteria bacterium]HPD71284.1 phenylphosphate carboxylase subunit delta [Candidatus Krumholzibacteria bacterium]HRY39016.1 phenylphosphate carboxylase subunit delta [Candidatus Krumholzibacteria bacterium]
MNADWPLDDAAAYRHEVERRLGKALADQLARVRLVVLDCDGVLTTGSLVYGPDGEALKVFDARDGLGLMMLRPAGIARALLSGRSSLAAARRCADLRFEAIKLGRFDKREALAEIWRETGCQAGETLYLGDDLLDLPALAEAAVAVTVPAAPAEVAGVCDFVTLAAGGAGAVREVCDLLLKARGAFGPAIRELAAGRRPADDPEVTH